MGSKKVVMFDYGGTLVDSEGFIFPALNRALEKVGLSPLEDKRDFLQLFSGPFHQNLLGRFPALSSDGALAERFDREFREEKLRALPEPFPGIGDFLRRLSLPGEFALYIVTAANEDFVKRVLSHWELLGYFKAVLGQESGASKAAKMERILVLENARPEECIYVGDTSGDVADAKTLGIEAAAVLWGYHTRDELERAGASFLAETPEGLLGIILGGRS